MQTVDHQELARCLFDESNDAFFIFRPEDNSLIDANLTALRLTGHSHAELVNRRLPELFSAETAADIDYLIEAFQKTGTFHSGENFQLRRQQADPLPVQVTASRIHAKPAPLGLAVVHDISQRKQAEAELKRLNEQLENRVAQRTADLNESNSQLRISRERLAGQNEVLEMIAQGRPLDEVLDRLVRFIEQQSDGMLASVAVLDDSGQRLRVAAAPSLPDEFNRAFDDLTIAQRPACCTAAVMTHEPVVVEDIATDPMWQGFQEEALRYGLKSSWCYPIHSSNGAVLGTFAVYFRECRKPNESDQSSIDLCVSLASVVIERDNAARSLRESEQRFRSLVEHSFDVITMLDATGTPRYVSPSITRMLGYEPHEFTGQPGLGFVHRDDVEQVGRILARCLEQPNELLHLAARVRHKDGSYRTLEATITNQLDVPGVAAFVSNFRDVTERLAAERALAANEAQLHQLAENIDEVLWVVAGDLSEVFYVSPAYERIWGRSVESLYENPRSFLSPVHEDDKPALMAAIRRRSEDETTGSTVAEYRIVRPDGDIRWIRSRQSSVSGTNGAVARMVGVAEDITDRKLAEDQLRASEQKFRALAELIPVSIGIAQDNRRVFGNRRSEQLTGYSCDELMGQETGSLTHPDCRDRMRQQVKDCLEQQTAIHDECRIVRKNGETRWVDFSATPFEWNGRPAMLGASVDITDRKQAEDRLREGEERYRRLVENSPFCVHELALDGTFESMNPAGLRMMGLANESEIRGVLYLDAVCAKDKLAVEARLEQARLGHSSSFEFATPMGQAFDSCFVPLTGNDGEVSRIMGITQDITERNAAEVALRESEERYRRVLEASGEAIIGLTIDGLVETWNHAAETMFGYSLDEMRGTSVARLLPADRSEEISLAKQVQSGRTVKEFETQRLTKDGRLIDIVLTIQPILDNSGVVRMG